MTDETQTLTREQELAEQFKEGLNPDEVSELAKRIAALEAERSELEEGLASLGYTENGGPEDVTLAGKAILALRGISADRDDAIVRAEKAEKAAETAKAKVSRGDTPAKPRKIGPMDGKFEGDALRDNIDEADKVEIVFSDGTKELTQIPPVVVEGEVWKRHALGMMLRDPIEITGPAQGEPGYQIDGYGLLLDGKQVAYCQRADPINVAPGQKYSLADDIYFA